MCGKPQDTDFGKAKAENLADIGTKLMLVVKFTALRVAIYNDTQVTHTTLETSPQDLEIDNGVTRAPVDHTNQSVEVQLSGGHLGRPAQSTRTTYSGIVKKNIAPTVC